MKKLDGNYNMADAMNFCKNQRYFIIGGATLMFFFAFLPPYYIGIDPRVESHIFPFYVYYTLYVVAYAIILGKLLDKPRKINKIVMEKAILLGCPIEIRQIGAKANNSYGTFVKINAEMLEILEKTNRHDNVKMQAEEISMKEPFVKELSLGAGTTEKFIGKNIPNFKKARKLGEIPGQPSEG